MTERVQKLRKQLLGVKPALSIERLRLETEAAKMFSGAPTPIYRAKILEYVFQHKSVKIYDGELLVGTVTEKVRAADIFPEYASGKLWLYETLPMISERPHDPFEISPEEVAEAVELLHYWDGKATEELTLSHIPQYLLDHENAGVYKSGNKGSVSGHVHPNYQRMMKGGFRAQIDRCKALIEEAASTGMTVVLGGHDYRTGGLYRLCPPPGGRGRPPGRRLRRPGARTGAAAGCRHLPQGTGESPGDLPRGPAVPMVH